MPRARAGEVMWFVYGTVALIAGLIMLVGLYVSEAADRTDYMIIITLSLICILAGLDWLNLIPEV